MRAPLTLLLIVLISTSEIAAQQPSTQPPPPMTQGLRILVLEGSGAVNNLERRIATPPVVEVRDLNDRPVEGAEVVFRVPASGPGGIFPGGRVRKTVKTNVQGQAAATGLEPNTQAGRFKIHVTASFGNLMGETEIEQSNGSGVATAVARKPPSHFGWWKWAAIAGAGAIAGGVVLATRGDSAAAKPPTIGVTPGPVVIGAPR